MKEQAIKIFILLFLTVSICFATYKIFMEKAGYNVVLDKTNHTILIYQPQNSKADLQYHLTKSLLFTEYYIENREKLSFSNIQYYFNSNVIKINKTWFEYFMSNEMEVKLDMVDNVVSNVQSSIDK